MVHEGGQTLGRCRCSTRFGTRYRFSRGVETGSGNMRTQVRKNRSLRSTLTRIIVALTLVSVMAVTSLVVVTRSLDEVTDDLSRSVESVHVVDAAEVQLLVHARLQDPLGRAQREAEVRESLDRAERFADTETELEILRSSQSTADEYFRSTEHPSTSPIVTDRLEAAFRSLALLAEVNVEQSQQARTSAERLGRVAELITLVAIIGFLVVVPFVLWWLNTRAFQSSSSLTDAMNRFADGRWHARAQESDPTELRKLAQDFNAMASRLESQRQSQATFLAGVAHDIRTPLQALKMSAAAVPDDQPLPSKEHLRKMLQVVRRQTSRLERLVEDLLNTARVEAGDLELHRTEVDLRELACTVVDLFSDTSPKHHLELDAPDEPVSVHCDPARIEQAFINIVSNAIKYSPEGGDVVVQVRQQAMHAVVSVRDQGVGISPREKERLFEPFYRAQRTDEDVKGVGLGLAMTRRLVEAHHGSIEVRSTLGRGTTLIVELPLSTPSRHRRAANVQ